MVPAAGEMVQMIAVLEFPPRLACSILVSLLSLKGTWLLPCSLQQRIQMLTVMSWVCVMAVSPMFAFSKFVGLSSPQKTVKGLNEE